MSQERIKQEKIYCDDCYWVGVVIPFLVTVESINEDRV